MAKKTQEAGELEEDFSDLDDIATIATGRFGGGGGGKKVFPVKLAEVIKQKYDRDCGTNESLLIPKEWLESKTGYDPEKPMKGRPNAFKRKLNRQHGDLAGEGHIWHVGNSDNKYYTISILEATPAEVDKWQKPKPKKEEVED